MWHVLNHLTAEKQVLRLHLLLQGGGYSAQVRPAAARLLRQYHLEHVSVVGSFMH